MAKHPVRRSLLRIVAALVTLAATVRGSTVSAQPAPSPPGPGPILTTAKALSDLQSAKVLPIRIAQAPSSSITTRDFAQLLAKTVGIDVPAALHLSPPAAASAAESATLAASAIEKLHLAVGVKSFAAPESPIAREDAVVVALNVAAYKGILRHGPQPNVYPPFADDADFSSAALRAVAHSAVFSGLMRVGPNNTFGPRKPLSYGDAAYLLDAIRLSGRSPERE